MKRIAIMLACVLLLSLLCTPALAAPRYPQRQGVVTDAAAVLSADTVTHLRTVADDLSRKANIALSIVTVDFLDGSDATAYAQGLQQHWQLDDNSLLILIAVGEDHCIASGGSSVKLPAATLTKLVSTYLEPSILRLDYNGAMYAFIPQLLTEVNKTYNVNITAEAFGIMPAATAVPFSYTDWMTSRQTARQASGDVAGAALPRASAKNDDGGFSLWKIILTFFLLSTIFKNSKRLQRHGCGCGCFPFSRILAAFAGLFHLWDWNRD